MNNIGFAFALAFFASLASGAGGLVVLMSKIKNTNFLSICLSISAGVMLYVSFAEILVESFEALEYEYGNGAGMLMATAAFFAGILLMAAIDKFIPRGDVILEPTELTDTQNANDLPCAHYKGELKRTGIMSAIALSIHNLPEGIMIFFAAMHEPAMGVAIAIAIAIHNIPEGISTASPIYYATGSRSKAFLLAAGAGFVQLLGAFIAWAFLRTIFYDFEGIFGIIFAAVAGIMVFVAIHELLPAAQKYGKHHVVMKWLFAGMGIMAISLVLLEVVI